MSHTQLKASSRRDAEAYEKYYEYCVKVLGVKPSEFSEYLKVTAPINPNPIAWYAAR